ncbi:MAG TPA: CBS domain-containing protein [Candidatus Cloacimonadota bacterium]|nr:CBS domain-containing protein [Candidatus Cloacimonadota bacterium]
MNEELMANATVKDIRHFIDNKPAVVSASTSIRETLRKIIDDTRSRHAYIVDGNGKLIGSIRMNNVIQYLFPTFSLLENQETFKIGSFMEYTSAQQAKDIMNPRPVYVYEDTLLSDMVSIMIQERVNEMPVINKEHQVIGEVNVLKIIAYYLKNTEEKGK